MNTLTVLSLAIVTACCSGSFVGYPGLYTGHLRHGYSTAHVAAPHVSVAHAPLHYNHVAHTPLHYNHAAPVTYNTVPYAPVAPIQSQYHAQDELGQYSFGYAGGPSSRVENRDAYGVVRGSYNYVDSEGNLQTQHYVADTLGFRVSGTNLPVAPDAPETAPLALPGPLPEPVQDTPEVAAAKAAHQAAYDEAAAAAAAAPDYADRKKRSVLATHALGHYSPLRFSYGFSAPLTYGHPLHYGGFPSYHHHHATPAVTAYHGAVAPALTAHVAPTEAATPSDTQLLRVVNAPHHAVSYRVH